MSSEQSNAELRERAIDAAAHPSLYVAKEHDLEPLYRWQTRAVLAALGLDDLDALRDRLAVAIWDFETRAHGRVRDHELYRDEADAVIAALTPSEDDA